MAELNDFQLKIITLARSKGWKDDLAWLGLGTFKEVGELWAAIEKYQMSLTTLDSLPEMDKADYKRRVVIPAEQEIPKEFSGVMHYLLQLMFKVLPLSDLDTALEDEIANNSVTKKKTYENGKIVRK